MRLCNHEYPADDVLGGTFAQWPFDLSSFQKHAVAGIKGGNHVLVTAHTGGGKTLCADYAIRKYVKEEGKKVIYTGPVKALNNQKFHEFQERFPDVSFGILTGDIKFNPDADVLVMTTEILRNTLFRKSEERQSSSLMFDMDMDNDLGCVVFDEVHYINDKDRGKVWEETIIMLPKSVRLVMLSATLDAADRFASWVEDKKGGEVWLCPTEKRVVPLSHWAFVTFPEADAGKFVSAKASALREIRETPVLLKEPGGECREKEYFKVSRAIKELRLKCVRVNKTFAMNRMVSYLFKKGQLPAIAFAFSRAQTRRYAMSIQTCLFPKGSKAPSLVEGECKRILMRLPNYREYMALPEYAEIVGQLRKGVAFHNAGVPQVFREMIELLFDRGYVQMLFATETFAVGINMPARSVVFTALDKWDGSSFRPLLSHEYSQMAGRAGRRGLDTRGMVYHMSNLILNSKTEIDYMGYRAMLAGSPQRLKSRFEIHFGLILRLVAAGVKDLVAFAENSMTQSAVASERIQLSGELRRAVERVPERPALNDREAGMMKRYCELKTLLPLARNNKRKRLLRELRSLEDVDGSIKDKYELAAASDAAQEHIVCLKNQLAETGGWALRGVKAHVEVLLREGFLTAATSLLTLTPRGSVAARIQETHCLATADLVCSGALADISPRMLVGVLACFVRVSIPDEMRVHGADNVNGPPEVIGIIKKIETLYNKYYDIELANRSSFADSYELGYDLCELLMKWCDVTDDAGAQRLCSEARSYDIQVGDFMKAVLKVANIASELEAIAEETGDLSLLAASKAIPALILKFVATNQSLYV